MLHQEIITGLQSMQATISPKYFYDDVGSILFEAITELPEYYPTRTEIALMQQYGAEMAQAIGPGATLIEFGAGNCAKASTLCRLIHPACFVGVDISADFLQMSVAAMRDEFPGLVTHAVGADIAHSLALPSDVPKSRRLVFYPGSSIGNFDPAQALQLLQRMRALIDIEGGLLIGIDLPKDVGVLEAAYNDAQGVTAAFNRNALSHINRLIGSDFNTDQWQHRAFFNTKLSRIEMHLEATCNTVVRWPAGARAFAVGERIHTENSYKYPLKDFRSLLHDAGFKHMQVWTDAQHWFAVVHAKP